MIPGNLDKLPQKSELLAEERPKDSALGMRGAKWMLTPLEQKAPHGSVGLAGAKLKDPL